MRGLLDWLARQLFQPPGQNFDERIFQGGFLGLLFLVGALHWAAFFDFGQMKFTAKDWQWHQYEYLSILKQSVTERVIPYHVSKTLLVTDAYLAVPETMLSPQILLMPFMTLGRFVMWTVVGLYAVGFIGCLLIRRRYRLSAVAFAVLFLLLNFNGYITSHLGVGHPWYGYFFLPFYCWLVLQIVEGRTDLTVTIGMALVLFAILLQGSLHIMIWCAMFLALVAVFFKPYRIAALLTFIFTGLLGLFRFLPAALEFRDKGYAFISGYRSLYDLFEAFVSIKEYDAVRIGGIFGLLGWWEYDIFIGVMPLAVVLYLGVIVRWRKDWDLRSTEYRALDLPLLIMFIASLSYFYIVIARLPIPLINVERVPSRFLIIPFLMVLVIACVRMQPALDRLEKWGNWKWLVIPALLETAFELANHSFRYSVGFLEQTLATFTRDMEIHIIQKAAPTYKAVVFVSAGVSALTLVVLVALLAWSSLRSKGCDR